MGKCKKWPRAVFAYRIIPNRSTECLDKSPGGGYIRFREPGATVTNFIYKRNRPSELGGASIRSGAFIGDNTVIVCVPVNQEVVYSSAIGPIRLYPNVPYLWGMVALR